MKVTAHHIESLDVFRGVTVAAMMLVNNPGDWSAVFPPLLHASWTGWTFADLVFPWFIFVMGVAMPFAFARRRGAGHATRRLYLRIGRRVALLVALGVILNAVAAWPAASPLRYPGVLQRIAFAYLIAAPIVLHFDVVGWLAAIAALMLGHWALLALVPFGGYPAGTLAPGHNLAAFVDGRVFGAHLMMPIDPEGLLGTLPAAATALLGALAGYVLKHSNSHAERVRRIAAGGAIAVAAGLTWATRLPISKPLWTGSFALVAAGLGALGLAVVYFIVDACDFRAWERPFLWLGVNPLAMYFLSEVVGHLQTAPKAWLFWSVLVRVIPGRPEWASLVFGLGFTGLWMAVAGLLHRRGLRVQV